MMTYPSLAKVDPEMKIHESKVVSKTHCRIQTLCRVSGTLGKAPITLGKGLPSVTLGKGHSAAILPVKTSLPSVWDGTRQKKVAVTMFGAMTASLPSALELALGKD
jgi:hypothetical protein